jgi:Protein of unknown function (DUF3187)
LRTAISYWLLVIGGTTSLPAQGLPPYAPINPAALARSGLETQPYLDPERRWHLTMLMDYASLAEYTNQDNAFYVQDAEILRVQLSVARSIGRNGFILAEGSFNGSYAGFMDGFFDWYHKIFGFHVTGRSARPKNEFDYEINLANGRSYRYDSNSGFLGDVRLGAGLRHSKHWQTTVSLTLPTSGSPAGYRKDAWSANATTTLRSEFGAEQRFLYEGTFGVGYTPTRGQLSDLQHTTFLMVTQGLRARIAGPLHAFGNLIYHSAYYHDTGINGLDGRELTADLGGMLRFKRGPEWLFSLTEDLEPHGPAIDISFRIGSRW